MRTQMQVISCVCVGVFFSSLVSLMVDCVGEVYKNKICLGFWVLMSNLIFQTSHVFPFFFQFFQNLSFLHFCILRQHFLILTQPVPFTSQKPQFYRNPPKETYPTQPQPPSRWTVPLLDFPVPSRSLQVDLIFLFSFSTNLGCI